MSPCCRLMTFQAIESKRTYSSFIRTVPENCPHACPPIDTCRGPCYIHGSEHAHELLLALSCSDLLDTPGKFDNNHSNIVRCVTLE